MKPINIAYIIAGILLFLTSCGTTSNEQNTNLLTEEKEKVSVKAIAIKAQNVPIVKTYFGQVNFKQSTTILGEMPGIVGNLNTKVGQRIQKGQALLNYPRSEENLDIEKKQIDQAQIAYDELKTNYERQKILFEKGAINKVTVEQIKTQLDMQEKVIEQLNLTLKKTFSIKAPYSGIITEVHIQEGQQIMPGVPIFSIAKTNLVEVEFFVLAKDYSTIQLGKTVYIISEGDTLKGKVSERATQMDPMRRAFRVKALLEHGKKPLLVGNTVEIKVQQEVIENAIVVPEETISTQGKEYYVYLAKGEKAERKAIQLGRRRGLEVVVTNGIAVDDLLITAGIEKLKNNSPITIIQ